MSLEEMQLMQTTRTTISIPSTLLKSVDRAVQAGAASNRNEFLAMAIQRELERIQRRAIDREFEAMADDQLYRREAEQISHEHRYADWEALRVAEDDS
jgi:metal-responsive CopG/Arc/MetJ family transcriptional regulator